MNTTRSRWKTRKGEWFLVGLICAVLAFLLYPAVQDRLQYGPPGQAIPIVPPAESRRRVHPSGISIILPENWEWQHHASAGDPSLSIWPRSFPRGGRRKSVITVQKWPSPTEPPVVTGFIPLKFQEFPAYERMYVYPDNNSPSNSLYELYVDRDGEWWLISFLIGDQQLKQLPPEIRPYIESVRLPPAHDP